MTFIYLYIFKIQSVQNQVRDVVGVMKQNIEKVVERGDNLNDLQVSWWMFDVSSCNFVLKRINLKTWPMVLKILIAEQLDCEKRCGGTIWKWRFLLHVFF